MFDELAETADFAQKVLRSRESSVSVQRTHLYNGFSVG